VAMVMLPVEWYVCAQDHCFQYLPSEEGVLILWSLWEVLTSTCNPDKNRIFRKARRNTKALDITLEDKSAKENN
jgi:hypothetical protein